MEWDVAIRMQLRGLRIGYGVFAAFDTRWSENVDPATATR